ncbi:MAG: preprotein translocase subunit SecG [Firmicutes bacterium]|nr:preprotein translocase subunit SecG [Bacillota bacterium]
MFHLISAVGDSVRPWVSASFPIIRMVLIVLMVLVSIILTACVLGQPGNSEGLGSISGSSDTFFGKNKGKTREGTMRRLTVICAASMVIICLIFIVTIIWYPGK